MRPFNCFPVAPNSHLTGMGFLQKSISWILGCPGREDSNELPLGVRKKNRLGSQSVKAPSGKCQEPRACVTSTVNAHPENRTLRDPSTLPYRSYWPLHPSESWEERRVGSGL